MVLSLKSAVVVFNEISDVLTAGVYFFKGAFVSYHKLLLVSIIKLLIMAGYLLGDKNSVF